MNAVSAVAVDVDAVTVVIEMVIAIAVWVDIVVVRIVVRARKEVLPASLLLLSVVDSVVVVVRPLLLRLAHRLERMLWCARRTFCMPTMLSPTNDPW